MHISGYNGADEDEIMDNVFSRYSREGLTPSGHKTGQKLLMKDDAKIAAGTILEAAHKLQPYQVPAISMLTSIPHGATSTRTTRVGLDTKRPTLSRDSLWVN